MYCEWFYYKKKIANGSTFVYAVKIRKKENASNLELMK